MSDNESALGSFLTVEIYFGGFSTDGGQMYAGASNHMLSASSAANVWYFGSTRSTRPPSTMFIPTLTFDKPGEREIVARFWVSIVRRKDRSFQVRWKADGTPEISGAAIWVKELVLRRAVTVLPAP
jgi:hypothetical protein